MSGQKIAGHVFISYVHEDSDQVDQLQRILEAAGIPVWRDTADLWPGEDWRARIRGAITRNALVFLACFSTTSLARSQSYMNEELVLAIEQLRQRPPERPWLIPVRLDHCEIPDLDIGAGRTLTFLQRADLFGNHYGDGARRLVAAIERILGRDSDSSHAQMGQPPPQEGRPRGRPTTGSQARHRRAGPDQHADTRLAAGKSTMLPFRPEILPSPQSPLRPQKSPLRPQSSPPPRARPPTIQPKPTVDSASHQVVQPPAPHQVVPPTAPRRRGRLPRFLVIGVAVLAAAGGATAWFLSRPTPAWVPGTGTAYVTRGDGIVPVNLATGQVGNPIDVAGTAYGIALSPQDDTAYVVDQTTCRDCTGTVGISSLLPVNLATGATGDAAAIAEGTAGSGDEAFQVVLSKDGNTAYVMGGGVVPVDLATRGKEATIKVGSGFSHIAISPDGSTLYVTTSGNEDLEEVSLATGKIGTDVKIGHAILAMAVAPGGGTVYVYDAGGIASVNPADGRVNWQITSPELGDGGATAGSLVVLPDGKTAYAGGAGTGVVPINLQTHQAGQMIQFNDTVNAMAASSDGKAIYVGGGSGTVYPINTATNQVGKTVSTGSSAIQFMTIAP